MRLLLKASLMYLPRDSITSFYSNIFHQKSRKASTRVYPRLFMMGNLFGNNLCLDSRSQCHVEWTLWRNHAKVFTFQVKETFKAISFLTPLPGPQLSWHCFMVTPWSPLPLDTIQRRKQQQQLFPKLWGNNFRISSFCATRKEKVETISKFLLSRRPFSWLTLWRDKVFVSVSSMRKLRCLSLCVSFSGTSLFVCNRSGNNRAFYSAYFLAFNTDGFVAMEIR